jgi:hypothetical protein
MAETTTKLEPVVTELRVMITEDGLGNLDVWHQVVKKGTEEIIQMRSSHVAGQLYAAAHVILAKHYTKITAEDEVKPAKRTPK